ncbi:MAG: hypothetical protein HQK75_20540 [Candidatus Magnetomorum sp.]|nr:hypothetical protein [Candidatus Magnetomorum sp.]
MQEGMEKGMQTGIKKGTISGIELGLDLKFGEIGLQLLPEIREIQDIDVLLSIQKGIKSVNSIENLRQIYA